MARNLTPPPCGSDPMELLPPPEWRDEEVERIVAWRLYELLGAGYPVQTAERLAARLDIDLHRAIGLVERGCKPEVAALILL